MIYISKLATSSTDPVKAQANMYMYLSRMMSCDLAFSGPYKQGTKENTVLQHVQVGRPLILARSARQLTEVSMSAYRS